MIRVEKIVANVDGRQKTLTSLNARVPGYGDLYKDENGELYTCSNSIQLRTYKAQINSKDPVISTRVGGRDRLMTNLHIRVSGGDLYRDDKGNLFVSSNGRTFNEMR